MMLFVGAVLSVLVPLFMFIGLCLKVMELFGPQSEETDIEGRE